MAFLDKCQNSVSRSVPKEMIREAIQVQYDTKQNFGSTQNNEKNTRNGIYVNKYKTYFKNLVEQQFKAKILKGL